MSTFRVPTYIKEIVDTWNRHFPEILRINPDWNSEPVGGFTMFPTINLTSLDLEGVWLPSEPFIDAYQVSQLIDAFTNHDIPILLIRGTKIRPIGNEDLRSFRTWLSMRFKVRED